MHDTMGKKEIIPVMYMYNKKRTTANRYYYNIAKSNISFYVSFFLMP